MGNKYLGKSCSFCKTPFTDKDVIAVCDTCDLPHHLSCWQENQGCATFGCTGKIKMVIGEEPAKPVQEKPAEAPKAAPSQRFETLSTAEQLTIQKDSAVAVEQVVLLKDNTSGTLLARCTLQSITERPINAVLVDVQCKDVWGNRVEGVEGHQFLDLNTKRGAVFGQTEPIALPDKNTRSVTALVKKVLYADGQIGTCGEEAVVFPAPVSLAAHFDSQDMADGYARETTSKAKYVPVSENGYWRCTCGSLNHENEEDCPGCGSSAAALLAVLNDPELAERTQTFVLAQQEAAAKAQAEQEERIRRAEEEVRAEKERRDAELKAAELLAQHKKKKKRTLMAILIPLASLIVAAALAIFAVIPLVVILQGNALLEAGQYDAAYDKYMSLQGYADGQNRANEAMYQKAGALLNEGKYDKAIEIYRDLGDYSNAPKMLNEATYQKADANLAKGNYTLAVSLFSGLGDYRDAAERTREAKYLWAASCQESGDYKKAYELYVELGNYKDSQAEVDATVLLWTAKALGSASTAEAESFCATVDLNYDQYELVYSTVLLYIYGHEEIEYWMNWDSWPYARSATLNTDIIVGMLPASYEDAALLQELFALLASDCWASDLFEDHEDLMRKCFDIPFIRGAAAHDYAICEFLVGYWTTSGRGYYIKFYEKENDGIWSYHTLPWVSKPYGTKYYNIEDCIYYWDDANNNHLTKVYRLEIISYDVIEVYCYKNGYTYTLYR